MTVYEVECAFSSCNHMVSFEVDARLVVTIPPRIYCSSKAAAQALDMLDLVIDSADRAGAP